MSGTPELPSKFESMFSGCPKSSKINDFWRFLKVLVKDFEIKSPPF